MSNNEYYVAELKYTDGNRVEMGEAPSYVVVQKQEDRFEDDLTYTRFVNIFTNEEYPTFSRSNKYGQYYYDADGEEHQVGCKLIQESTTMKEGPCFILTRERMENIPVQDIENMIIYSSRYFKDRARIMNRRGMRDMWSRRVLFEDSKKREEMLDYFVERGCYDFNRTTNTKGNMIRFRR